MNAPRADLNLQAVKQSLGRGLHVRLQVNGGSMAPTLRQGDAVDVQPLDGATPLRGDILVIERHNDLVTHRLIERQAGAVITKGDANASPDPAASVDAVLGQVTGWQHGGRQYVMSRQRHLNAWLGLLGLWEARLYRALGGETAGSALPGRLHKVYILPVFPFRMAYRLAQFFWR